MSPAASDGLRAPFDSRGAFPGTMNGVNGVARKGETRIYPHIDDLTAVRPTLDPNSPIRKILIAGEELAKQADTHLDFRRPDIAVQEYVKACVLLSDIVPRHKDYPTLLIPQTDLNRQLKALAKRVNTQSTRIEEAKAEIKENNARSGIKPADVTRFGFENNPKPNSTQNGHARAQSVQHESVSGQTNGISVSRKKPLVQPKPDALHGNAIHSRNQSTPPGDLATRFANLRPVETNGAVQDPRIRTQSISIPKSSDLNTSVLPPGNHTTASRPYGPRDLPSVPTPIPRGAKLSLDVQLPRPPDAIYNSPARNADSGVTENLPSSAPRSSSFHGSVRQGPAPPVAPTPRIVENQQDYFSQAPHLGTNGVYPQKKTPKPVLPDSTTISAEQLVNYLKLGSTTLRVLIVDIRNRDEFECGHIMSQTILCVEPVILEHDVSGEELADRLIIAPESERDLYDQRDEFDLVVFYDQSSSSIKQSLGPGSDGALYRFAKAVFDYGYDRRLKRHPALLVGGLDAWMDLLGPNCLKASISRTSSPAPNANGNQRSVRPLGRHPAVRNPPSVPLKRRKTTHSSRPLSKEEETLWDQKLREDYTLHTPNDRADSVSEDLVYARTTEDFFRRYPELPAIQESMVSPMPSKASPSTSYQHIVPSVPAPPARPPPALPRQRSSGLSEKGPTVSYPHSNSRGGQSLEQSRVAPGLTGLSNPGVHCYMNAAVQALSATPFLRDHLVKFQYPANPPLPRKAGETSDPPQLMVRSLGNLLGHLWNGAFDFISPTTFPKYVNDVHAGKLSDLKVRKLAYGGPLRQHDSSEFMEFLLEILDDELNPLRNVKVLPNDDAFNKSIDTLPPLQASNLAWSKHVRGQDSILTRNMEGQIGFSTTCNACKAQTRSFDTFKMLTLSIKDDYQQTLQSMIESEWNTTETIDDYTCENCKKKGLTASRRSSLYMLPEYLVLSLKRYNSSLRKLHTVVSFPESGIDLGPAFGLKGELGYGAGDYRQKGPFRYRCYAAIMHIGESISQGHYTTLAKSTNPRTGNGDWHKFNDSHVTKAKFQDTNSKLTSIIFLKREKIQGS